MEAAIVMLSKSELSAFQQKLLSEKEEIESLLIESAESRSAVELDQTSVGRLSRMDAMQAQQMALAAGRKRQLALSRIHAALQRIEDGDYGYCLTCDEEIAVKRLALDPAAPTCISCANKEKP